MELAAGQPRQQMRAALAEFHLAAIALPRQVVDPSMALACHAGLWLAHNFLDESHEISQQIETPTGSFWHAIMHRREGDFDNAAYWFRRVREHAIYQPLGAAVAAGEASDPQLASLTPAGHWDPLAFVQLVRSVVTGRTGKPTAAACRRIARLEWQLLWDFCYQQA